MQDEQEMIGRYIERQFDIQGLIDEGFFQTDNPDELRYIKGLKDYKRIEKHINHFFGFDHIFDYSDVMKEKPKKNPVISAGEWLDKNHEMRAQPN